MKLYLKTGARDHKIICQPGKEFPTSDFCAPDGTPRTFTVNFVKGFARNVPDTLGQYLLDKDLAQRSPIIVDLAMAARLDAHDERVRSHRILAGV